jgi:hypothetical protein
LHIKPRPYSISDQLYILGSLFKLHRFHEADLHLTSFQTQVTFTDKVELTVLELLKLTSLKALLGCKTGKLTEPAGVHQAFKEVEMLILNRHQDEPYLRVKYYLALAKVLAKGGFL